MPKKKKVKKVKKTKKVKKVKITNKKKLSIKPIDKKNSIRDFHNQIKFEKIKSVYTFGSDLKCVSV